ncbi:hypothetical protein LUZ61_019295 [Rhynchospora tenuis]|uniref:MATH domain-containing protein n=1 Tax=Rhynchospora tenuis TaxID=198213 RepID=A0AAD5ZAU9_9POAL|nr:hypothetical protein LUZ61_019295 [Rhynchospora tenuis]
MGSSISCVRVENNPTAFNWRIDGFSSLLEQGSGWSVSKKFEIHGQKWLLHVNPFDEKSDDSERYVSLRLELANASEHSCAVQALFKFCIYDRLYGKHIEQKVYHNFEATSAVSGVPCMISLENLMITPGFIIDDSIIFGVELIKVNRILHRAVSENLVLYKNKVSSTYTWNIDNFYKLPNPKAFSSYFYIGGCQWIICLYPKGVENNNFISLYLCLSEFVDLVPNTEVFVEYDLYIKDQEKGKHMKNTGRCTFIQTAKRKAYGWGKRNFISLEEFESPFNGYLVNTRCVVEASITILGSSGQVPGDMQSAFMK